MGTSGDHGSKRVAVIGAGSWGTALSIVAANNHHRVTLWSREPEIVTSIENEHRNSHYLPEFLLPENVHATGSYEAALDHGDFVLIVVPSHAMREVMSRMKPLISPGQILVSATKGVENETLMRMDQVVEDVLGFQARFVALSGPSFAREVANGDPTAIVAASLDADAAQEIQLALSSNVFRVYTNDDVIGVELGGAIKNVVAIGAGVVRGLGLGTNAVAALITRGLAEMTRLAIACGAKPETMAGLAGLGDLVLTCTGDLSRNRFVGLELGKGRTLHDILTGMREVAEGVKTTRAIYELGRRLEIEMPITSSIYSLLYEGKTALEAAHELMGRPLKHE
jgi:glycerol-3-phosphate dehydrogenase (NAD(P)+)